MPRKSTDQGDTRIDEAARQVTIASRSGEKSASAEPSDRRPARRLSAGRKALVAVVAVLSITLIGVSAWFLFLPSDTDSMTEDMLQTTVELSADDGARHEGAQGNEAEDNTSGQSDGQASPSNDSSYSSGTQGDSGSSAGGSNGSDQQLATVTVSVSVSSSVVGGPVSGSANPTFNQGATAYDALMACGLLVSAPVKQYGVYVESIGGLGETGPQGQNGGWMYSVNDVEPAISCANYILADGDNVQWYYVLL